MRKRFSMFAAFALLIAVSINSSSYFTFGDSVRIPPRYSDGYFKMDVCANFDAYCDTWQLNMGYPEGLMVKLVSGITPLEGMTVGYIDQAGAYQTFDAPLQVSAYYSTISSHISVPGFWDYNLDGVLESYGSAKWEPGLHQMFSLNFYISPEFRSGWLTIDGNLSSGNDSRGPILGNVQCFRRTWLWVGYEPGDVTGNDKLSIDDVTALINYLLSHDGLDEFEVKAADANQDGKVSITDVTTLINSILN